MFPLILKATRMLLTMALLSGVVYPLLVTAAAQTFFPAEANGSLVERDGRVVGSSLVAQRFPSPRYFRARPSASDFATVPSGASNLGPTSAAEKTAVETRSKELGPGTPPELLLASGSGLDPHVSREAAIFQLNRVMTARGIQEDKRPEIEALVAAQVESPTFGFLGNPRVNVLLLNLELDRRFP